MSDKIKQVECKHNNGEACPMCDEALKDRKFRKCFVLREIEIDMEDLQRGDIFRLGKATSTDCVNENEYSVATKNSVPSKDGNTSVMASIVTSLNTKEPLPWGTISLVIRNLRKDLPKLTRREYQQFIREKLFILGGACEVFTDLVENAKPDSGMWLIDTKTIMLDMQRMLDDFLSEYWKNVKGR